MVTSKPSLEMSYSELSNSLPLVRNTSECVFLNGQVSTLESPFRARYTQYLT